MQDSTMSNRVTLAQLLEMPLTEAKAIPLEQIYMLLEDCAIADGALKQSMAKIDLIQAELFADKAAALRAAKGADTGTVRITEFEEDGFEIVCEMGKTVSWDDKELLKSIAVIESWGEDASEYVDIKTTTTRKISENKFKAWPKKIASVFEPARTVKPGKPNFIIKKLEAA